MTSPAPAADASLVGCCVATCDGVVIGTIRAARDGYFQVAAARASDYWLPATSIAATEDGQVRLTFAKAKLRYWKNVTAPGPGSWAQGGCTTE